MDNSSVSASFFGLAARSGPGPGADALFTGNFVRHKGVRFRCAWVGGRTERPAQPVIVACPLSAHRVPARQFLRSPQHSAPSPVPDGDPRPPQSEINEHRAPSTAPGPGSSSGTGTGPPVDEQPPAAVRFPQQAFGSRAGSSPGTGTGYFAPSPRWLFWFASVHFSGGARIQSDVRLAQVAGIPSDLAVGKMTSCLSTADAHQREIDHAHSRSSLARSCALAGTLPVDSESSAIPDRRICDALDRSYAHSPHATHHLHLLHPPRLPYAASSPRTNHRYAARASFSCIARTPISAAASSSIANSAVRTRARAQWIPDRETRLNRRPSSSSHAATTARMAIRSTRRPMEAITVRPAPEPGASPARLKVARIQVLLLTPVRQTGASAAVRTDVPTLSYCDIFFWSRRPTPDALANIASRSPPAGRPPTQRSSRASGQMYESPHPLLESSRTSRAHRIV